MGDQNHSFSDDGGYEPNCDDNVIRLKSSGMLLNRNVEASEYGLIMTYTNYTMRNKSCPVTSVVFNSTRNKKSDSNVFIIADSRGQVYHMNITDNIYTSIRLASTAISVLSFVNSNRNHIIIGYENGNVIVVDTIYKNIVGNIQLTKLLSNQQGQSSPARLVKSHPTLPIVLIVTDSKHISVWNIETFECTQSLNSIEPLIDVRFEFDGNAIAITKKFSGVFLYDTNTAEFLIHLKLPKKERRVGWTCYTSYKCNNDKSKGINVLLSSENSMVYSWYVSISNLSQPVGHLLGVLELPLKMQMAVSLIPLSTSSTTPRILILSNSGDVIIVEISGFAEKSVGIWTIVSDLNSDQVALTSFISDRSLLYNQSVFRPTAIGDDKTNSSLQTCLGKVDARDNYFVFVGLDGNARLFDAELSLDYGKLCGLRLACRPPAVDLTKSDPSDFYLDNNNNSHAFKAVTYPSSANNNKRSVSASRLHKTSAGVMRSKVISNTSSNNTQQQQMNSSNKSKSNNRSTKSYGSLIINKKVDPNAELPLFELAALTSKEQQLNNKKLKAFLSVQKEYPSRYRPLIWRFLLKLPENSQTFSELTIRGIHESYENLYDKYPIQSRKIFARLQELCSRIAHWAPILGDAPYLPAIVFPFMLLFGNDDLAAFETCLSIMMWWGHSWHITHPNPPVHILDGVDALLKFHDPRLHSHLTNLNISIGTIGWNMISSFFSEILGRNDWLKLVDFIFTNFENISIMLCIPVAILKELKVSLLTTTNATQIIQYCRNQQGINIDACIGNVTHMTTNTPTRYFTAVTTKYIDTHNYEIGNMSSKGMRDLNDIEIAKENMSLANGRPLFPLTRGRYPVYDGYPKHIVDLQLLERSKVLAMGKEISRKEDVLRALQEKLAEVENEHSQWVTSHAGASEADMKYQREVMTKEKLHLEELQRIEEEISLQRINLLKSLEVIAKEQMDINDRSTKDCVNFIKEGEEHLKLKQSIQYNLLKHKELAEMAEVKTMEQISKLRMNRMKEDMYSGVTHLVKSKEDEFAAKDSILHEKWLKEDDEQRIKRQNKDRDLQLLHEHNKFNLLEEEATDKIAKLHIMRDAKILEIERTRSTRIAKEQSMDAIEAAERASLILSKQKVKAEEEHLAKMTEMGLGKADSQLSETIRNIKLESEKILDTERMILMREAKVRQQAAQAQLRKDWSEKTSEQLGSILKSEKELQEQLIELKRKSVALEIDNNLSEVHMGDYTTSVDNDRNRDYIEPSQHRGDIHREEGQRNNNNFSPSSEALTDESSVKFSNIQNEEKRDNTNNNNNNNKVRIAKSNSNHINQIQNEKISQLEMLSSDDEDEEEIPLRDALKRANKVLLQEDSSSTSGTDDPILRNYNNNSNNSNKQVESDYSIHFSKIYTTGDDSAMNFQPTIDLINNNRTYGKKDEEAYTNQMNKNYFVNENVKSETMNRRNKQSYNIRTATTMIDEVEEDDYNNVLSSNVELTVDSDSALWAYENTND